MTSTTATIANTHPMSACGWVQLGRTRHTRNNCELQIFAVLSSEEVSAVAPSAEKAAKPFMTPIAAQISMIADL